jgi:hypothetical protein
VLIPILVYDVNAVLVLSPTETSILFGIVAYSYVCLHVPYCGMFMSSNMCAYTYFGL